MLGHWLPSLKKIQSTLSQYEEGLETFLFLPLILKYAPVVPPSSYIGQTVTKIQNIQGLFRTVLVVSISVIAVQMSLGMLLSSDSKWSWYLGQPVHKQNAMYEIILNQEHSEGYLTACHHSNSLIQSAELKNGREDTCQEVTACMDERGVRKQWKTNENGTVTLIIQV